MKLGLDKWEGLRQESWGFGKWALENKTRTKSIEGVVSKYRAKSNCVLKCWGFELFKLWAKSYGLCRENLRKKLGIKRDIYYIEKVPNDLGKIDLRKQRRRAWSRLDSNVPNTKYWANKIGVEIVVNRRYF